MNQSFQKVLGYLSGDQNLELVPVEDLQKLVAENPFFPVSHFLLAKKLKSVNETSFSTEVQKTALYFSNPLWLDYSLTHNEELQDEQFLITEDKPLIIETVAAPDRQPENNTPSISTNGNENNEDESATSPEVVETKETPAEQLLNDVPAAAEAEVVAIEEEMAGVTHTEETITTHFLEEAEQKEEAPIDDEHDRMFQNIKAMLDASSEEAVADTKNAVIPIDPYYTIDYFASQGIKLELDPNPQDQLGQHLKKFTHWLKHMKKLGPEDATEVITRTETDADIQQIADSSNTVREVVTEAMASVLEKQGKKDKAIELYNKLSFLNPDKSAYFADQIKKLKGY